MNSGDRQVQSTHCVKAEIIKKKESFRFCFWTAG